MADPESTEIWLPVPEFEKHLEVSSFGRVRFVKSHQIINPTRATADYIGVVAKIGETRVFASVHRLVCRTFHGDPGVPPEGVTQWHVRHLDGDNQNNRAGNLIWGTPSENSGDRTLHGRSRRGEENNKSKLTAAKVAEIRKLYSSGIGCVELGKRFDVQHTTISAIIRRAHWEDDGVFQLDGEEWRQIRGDPRRIFDLYEVSSLGRVRRICLSGGFRLRKPEHRKDGRNWIQLSRVGGGVVCRPIDELVAIAFLQIPQTPSSGFRNYIKHVDGDVSNDKLLNLAWDATSKRQIHKAWSSHKKRTTDKLTEEAVKEIRSSLAAGQGVTFLSKKYGVTPSIVSMIKTRKIWKTTY